MAWDIPDFGVGTFSLSILAWQHLPLKLWIQFCFLVHPLDGTTPCRPTGLCLVQLPGLTPQNVASGDICSTIETHEAIKSS